MELSLYAVARAGHGGYTTSGRAVIERTGDYLERLHLGRHASAVVAMTEALRAHEKQTCFHGSRGWYTTPADLFHELWTAPAPGTRPAVVGRIQGDTLTVTRTLADAAPPHQALTDYADIHQLVAGQQPTRTARLSCVITEGGQLPAQGA